MDIFALNSLLIVSLSTLFRLSARVHAPAAHSVF